GAHVDRAVLQRPRKNIRQAMIRRLARARIPLLHLAPGFELEKPAYAERHLLELRDVHLLAQLQRRPDADLRVVRNGKVLETRAQELPRVERRYVERAFLAVHELDDAVASFERRRRRGHPRAR